MLSYTCLGEFKTGQNRLQLKKGELNIGGKNNPVYSRCIWVKIFCFLCDFGSVVSYKLPVLGTFMVVLGSYVNVPVLSQKETLFQEEQCTSCLGFSHIEIYGSYGCIFMKMIQSCEHYLIIIWLHDPAFFIL